MIGRNPMTNKSVEIDGDNSGVVNTGTIETLNLILPLESHLPLSSFLSDVVIGFADATSSANLIQRNKKIPPAIEIKLAHNYLKRNMALINAYTNYGYVLESTYEAVEQYNQNARFFVRSSIGNHYLEVRDNLYAQGNQSLSLLEFVQGNSDNIVDQLRKQLLSNFAKRKSIKAVHEEVASYAVGLLIADSVMECAVLEKPSVTAS
jgi:hypothetical protein